MVWTAQNRERYDRRGQRYPSDLTNEEWIVREPRLCLFRRVLVARDDICCVRS